MSRNECLINRRNAKVESERKCVDKEIKVCLFEEIFVLALRDGKISFWNENLSVTLRGCILIELSLRGRIRLEPRTLRNVSIQKRKVIVVNGDITGERLLDETLKFIKESQEGACVSLWLELLSGENWNPWHWKYQLRNVKDRIGKDLIEKRILGCTKSDFFFFNTTNYWIADINSRQAIVEKMQLNLLNNWKMQQHLMDKRALALIFATYSADLQEEIFDNLKDSDATLAKKRLSAMISENFQTISDKDPENDIIWAVFDIIIK